MFRDLPESPNLDHLKKQAKALLRALKQSNPKAKLTEAQHAVARSYGFASWTKLKAHIESILPAADAIAVEAGGSHGGVGGGPVAGPTEPIGSPGGSGQFARYTESARRTVFFARAWARKRDSELIEPEHLLLGLIDADAKLMDRLLGQEHGGREAEFAIRRELDRRTTTTSEKVIDIQRPLSSECRRVLQHAADEADRMRHDHIGTGHFLLGFMSEEDAAATSILMNILADKGISPEKAQANIVQILNEESH